MISLAISLEGLQSLDHPEIVGFLLGGRLDTSPFTPDCKDAQVSVKCREDLELLETATALDVLRIKAKELTGIMPKVYVHGRNARSWAPVGEGIPLTIVEGQEILLNTDVFGVAPTSLVAPNQPIAVELDGESFF